MDAIKDSLREGKLDYEVVVAGGGTAGAVAAIAAARSGKKTILIERQNCLGGTITSGLIIQFGGGGYACMGGILKEIVDGMIKSQEAVFLQEPDVNIPFNPEALKDLLLQKVLESGVEVMLYSQIVDVILDGRAIKGLVVENKAGSFEIYGKVVIDATGDADVAYKSGAPCIKLDNGGILGARVANIDYAQLLAYMRANPDQICENDTDKPLIRFIGFFDLVEKGFKDGVLEADMMKIPEFLLSVEGTHEGLRRYLRVDGAFPEKGIAMIGYGASVKWDIDNPFSYTVAEAEARRKNRALMAFLQGYIPGFRQAYIIQSAASLAIWASRKIVGEYVLTSEDVHNHRKFSDVVVKAHGNLDHRTLHIQSVPFDIPYKAMVPLETGNLLVAGRNISTSADARIPGINIPICMQLGEVVGLAAALSIDLETPVGKLPVAVLQQALVKSGVL